MDTASRPGIFSINNPHSRPPKWLQSVCPCGSRSYSCEGSYPGKQILFYIARRDNRHRPLTSRPGGHNGDHFAQQGLFLKHMHERTPSSFIPIAPIFNEVCARSASLAAYSFCSTRYYWTIKSLNFSALSAGTATTA